MTWSKEWLCLPIHTNAMSYCSFFVSKSFQLFTKNHYFSVSPASLSLKSSLAVNVSFQKALTILFPLSVIITYNSCSMFHSFNILSNKQHTHLAVCGWPRSLTARVIEWYKFVIVSHKSVQLHQDRFSYHALSGSPYTRSISERNQGKPWFCPSNHSSIDLFLRTSSIDVGFEDVDPGTLWLSFFLAAAVYSTLSEKISDDFSRFAVDMMTQAVASLSPELTWRTLLWLLAPYQVK